MVLILKPELVSHWNKIKIKPAKLLLGSHLTSCDGDRKWYKPLPVSAQPGSKSCRVFMFRQLATKAGHPPEAAAASHSKCEYSGLAPPPGHGFDDIHQFFLS